MAILAKLLDMDFKFVLPCMYINFDTQTNFEVNQTQISHFIPKNNPKNQQCGHYLKTPFCPSVIHLLHFSMNLSETFRINVNMDVAHTNHGRFFDLGLQTKFEGKARKRPDILRVVLGPNMQNGPFEASEQKLGQQNQNLNLRK